MRHLVVCCGLTTLLLAGCVPCSREPEMTQLQIREIQTREFEVCDVKLVMKGMMNVLQDDGFIIKNAVSDLGLLTAEKDIDISCRSEIFIAVLAKDGRWKQHSVQEISANVTAFGNRTRVRVNFQTKTFDNMGAVVSVVQDLDPETYQSFFARVSKAIFFEEEKI
ncbi:MAG: hypothetical protein LLG04_05900 [Parachlamydia sp.]|nr:hypothetical protein [Parachlamydia sp.]